MQARLLFTDVFMLNTRYKCLVITGRMPACHMLQYLPHDAMLARYMLSLRVRLSVRTYGVRLSLKWLNVGRL